MIESFINSNDNIRYLYVSKNVTNVIKFLLSKCIRNLLKTVIIFNHMRYLQFCILIKTSSINEIE